VGNEPLEGELNFSARHQACDMYYSVVWNTDALSPMSKGHIDLLSRQELWLARLGNWSEALSAYQEKLNRDPSDFEALLGCMRCLDAGSEWKEVLTLFDNSVTSVSAPNSSRHFRMRDDIPQKSRRKALRMCAHAAWRLGQWGDLDKFATELVGGPGPASPEQTSSATSKPFAPKILDFDAAFYTAILRINQRMWKDAAEAIDSARRAMDGRLTALMAESYGRAYPSMVTAQTLAEMEEIIEFRLEEECSASASSRHTIYAEENLARDRLLSVWRERLAGCRVDAEVHATIMAVRSLVLGPEDGIESTLKLSSLCDQAQRYSFAAKVLLRPLAELNADLEGPVFGFELAEIVGSRINFDKISAAALGPAIDQVVVSDLKSIVPAYGEHREQLSKGILDEAGGVERYVSVAMTP
jgi:tetratricopeptide (TPR) repeat protein